MPGIILVLKDDPTTLPAWSERDPEKCEAVFRKDHAQNKNRVLHRVNRVTFRAAID